MKPTPIWKFLQAICRVVTSLVFDLKVYGSHRVPETGGVLLISNHQSNLDPVLLGVRLKRPLSYLAKSELFTFAPFAWLIRSLGAFPVKQGAGDVGAVKETIQRLHEGHALNIYPEGSRSPDGQILPIEKGVALVIKRAKVPVLPAVIDGSHRAWPKGRSMFRAAPIRVYYGQPADLSNLDRDEILHWVDQTLHRMLADLREGRVPLDHREI